jgi:hypothetical protein
MQAKMTVCNCCFWDHINVGLKLLLRSIAIATPE